MKLMRYIFVLIASLALQNASAQIFTTVIDEEALRFRVKQIDEFFDRFNYETNYKGEKPKDPSDRDEHKKNLLTIFNLEKFLTENEEMDSTLIRFVDYVMDNNVKIHYEDTTWVAEACGSFTCDGKKHDVVLLLKTERVKDVIFKWVITDVQSSFFNRFPFKPKDNIIISPAEHGIGFMTLPETLNLNKLSIGTTFYNGYKRNYLVLFDYLMATGKIKMNAITKVLYHFRLKDFNFDVERIEKEKGYNQGWLINSITINNQQENEK